MKKSDTALLILIVLDRETIAVTGRGACMGGRGDTGMRVGVWMPTAMPFELERSFFLDWVRLADQAGFDTLSSLDRPNYDMWDPLASLAAAAAVTQRIRLATATLPLPNRNEVLVAKQAAVIDRLSDGRLTLGVSLGSRPDDYQAFGATLEQRVTRFRHQVATLRRIWAEARHSDREHGVLGPPPVQDPGPPIWIGALTEQARQRAVELADGFIFGGAARLPTIGLAIQSMRPQVAERGKPDFSFNAVAYVAFGGEPEFAEAVAHHRRYYPVLPVPAEQAIHHGPRGRKSRLKSSRSPMEHRSSRGREGRKCDRMELRRAYELSEKGRGWLFAASGPMWSSTEVS